MLPAQRAQALVNLSRRRSQSVAQILRGLIDRALIDDDDCTPHRGRVAGRTGEYVSS